MAIVIADLTMDKDYANGKRLTEDQLDQGLITTDGASLTDYVNTYVKDNLVQLAIDSWGINNLTFTDNGAASKTNTLFNKQYSTTTYDGGDLTLGTSADVGWADVDLVNAAVSFTPETIGQYKVTFTFTHRAASTATTEFTCETSFRLSDGTDTSAVLNSGGYLPATAASSGVITNPVSISVVFDWTNTLVKTISLQKYNRTMTAVTTNVAAASSTTGELHMLVEKI